MIKSDREIIGKELIKAVLDMMHTVHLGFAGEEYPYVVPLNFGYEYQEDLIIYIHCRRDGGYKLKLLEKNPRVCATFSDFRNYPDLMYKGHRHDYRSVMAFGEASEVTDKKEFARGLRLLLEHNHRKPGQFKADDVPKLRILKIVCPADQVFGKSEFPVRTVEDVPFADPYSRPYDEAPYDISDLEAREKRPSRFE